MNERKAAALVALAVLLPGAFITLDDYRDGRSRFWLSGGINMFTFERQNHPALFWGSTIINSVFIAALSLFCVLMVIFA